MTADPAGLRKCPFCGGEAKRDRKYDDGCKAQVYRVYCIECLCTTDWMLQDGYPIAARNTRAKEIEDEG